MWISSIYIDGYRKFHKQTINMERPQKMTLKDSGHENLDKRENQQGWLESDRGVTVLAGANNSGKTSLVELLGLILGDGNKSFQVDDFASKKRGEWFDYLISCILEQKELEDINTIAPTIVVRIEVKYDADNDDISKFADYLMDLDESKSSFYFEYVYSLDQDKFRESWNELQEAISRTLETHECSILEELKSGTSGDGSLSVYWDLQNKIDSFTVKHSKTTIFYTDEEYSTKLPITPIGSFKDLFNLEIVYALRQLADLKDDRPKNLGEEIVRVAQSNEKWNELVTELPSKIVKAISDTGVRKETLETSLVSLNKVIDEISSIGGNAKNKIEIDLLIEDTEVSKIVAKAMQMRYQSDGNALGEASQGLGYSNLVYLYLKITSFLNLIQQDGNNQKVNLLILEEPESHMHPQMQAAFIKFIYEIVCEKAAFQILTTTHSNEIVRSSSITQLRALKNDEAGCRIVDLRKFYKENIKGKDKEIKRLYSLLYSVNFSDVLFADKVIMYEGDTERMYIQALIRTQERFRNLRTQYVSYVQVGGAYAHVYMPLIEILHTKTVILTDIDYVKPGGPFNRTTLKEQTTTNATLNRLFENPTIKDLYDKTSDQGVALVGNDGLIAVAYQSDKEGYSRTFEEAVLSVVFDKDVFDSKSCDYWNSRREGVGLNFTIPHKNCKESGDMLTIQDIVGAIGKYNKKTDFTYSLLMNPALLKKIPPYIESALEWLAE